VRYNSRSNGNNYLGDRTTMIIFLDGKVGQVVDPDPQICGSLSYQRYPELEQMGPPT